MYSIEEPKHPPTRLTVPTQQASRLISVQIKRGQDIINMPIVLPKKVSKLLLDTIWDPLRKWDAYNSTLLRKLFTDDSIASEYDSSISLSSPKNLKEW